MIDHILKFGMEYFGLYYGIYKAQVTNNNDPMGKGRLVINCPQVHGRVAAEIWAEPKSPAAGDGFGFWAIPDVGEWVWVHFDHGRAEFPIWDGGWWAVGEPTTDMVRTKVALVTKEGMKIVIDRTAKTILIEQSPGNSLELTQTELKLRSATKILLDAPAVDITGTVSVTGDGDVSGTWTATHNSGHHTHPLGPDPLDPTTTIALQQP